MKEYIVRLTNKARQQLLNPLQAGRRLVRVVRQALGKLEADGVIGQRIAKPMG